MTGDLELAGHGERVASCQQHTGELALTAGEEVGGADEVEAGAARWVQARPARRRPAEVQQRTVSCSSSNRTPAPAGSGVSTGASCRAARRLGGPAPARGESGDGVVAILGLLEQDAPPDRGPVVELTDTVEMQRRGGTMAPGGMAPPHVHHREDETFWVLDGELTLTVGDDTVVARPAISWSGLATCPTASSPDRPGLVRCFCWRLRTWKA